MRRELDYEALANLFAVTYGETHSIPDALRVVVQAVDKPFTQAGLAGIDRIVAEVARAHGIRPQSIVGQNRCHAVSLARKEVWWLLHRRGLAQTAIAREFDRNSTTVCMGIRSFAALMDGDAELRARMLWAAAEIGRRAAA
jgi:chromosomal replication initiation ATPase DnaA